MAGSDSFYNGATSHKARQINVIGVMQSDAISAERQLVRNENQLTVIKTRKTYNSFKSLLLRTARQKTVPEGFRRITRQHIRTEQMHISFKGPNMKKEQRGFTLFELMVALVIAATLTVIAVSAYTGVTERVRVAAAVADIGEIHLKIQKFLLTENRGYPATLAELDLDNMIDPWGNPYRYLVVDGLGNNGAVRKDHNLVPVNRRYDVYSMGKDGVSASPFTSRLGRDDIVLAGDGTYFGKAEDF